MGRVLSTHRSTHPSHQEWHREGDTNGEGDSSWARLLLTAPFLHQLLSEPAGCCGVSPAPHWSSPQDPGTPFMPRLCRQIY